MKILNKITLTITISLLGVTSHASAINTTYLNPDISTLPAGENINQLVKPSDKISSQTGSVYRFCNSFQGSYVSHQSTLDTITISEYFENEWIVYNASQGNYATEIECDIPQNNTGAGKYNEGGNIGSGTTLKIAYQDNYGVYHMSEDFLIGLIVRIILSVLFFTLMWKYSRVIWNQGAKLSPFIR